MPVTEQRNERTKLNSASVTQSIIPRNTSAASSDANDMAFIAASAKRGTHEDSP